MWIAGVQQAYKKDVSIFIYTGDDVQAQAMIKKVKVGISFTLSQVPNYLFFIFFFFSFLFFFFCTTPPGHIRY
jgi:hypothetical protein